MILKSFSIVVLDDLVCLTLRQIKDDLYNVAFESDDYIYFNDYYGTYEEALVQYTWIEDDPIAYL